MPGEAPDAISRKISARMTRRDAAPKPRPASPDLWIGRAKLLNQAPLDAQLSPASSAGRQVLFDHQPVLGVEAASRVPGEELFGSVMRRFAGVDEIGHEAFP